MAARYLRVLLLGLLALAALFAGPAPLAQAATFTVDSTGDGADFSTADGVCDTDDSDGDGPCTLRAAIEEANANAGSDTINFSISGADPHTISPSSDLPTITDPVTIDGTSEPDFAGTPIVELDGSGAGVAVGGFMTADRLTLHWYVPEDNSGAVSTLQSQVSDTQSDISLFAGAIDRMGTAVTINSLVNNLGGFQQSDSPAAMACRDWLLFGQGEITDCGFTR